MKQYQGIALLERLCQDPQVATISRQDRFRVSLRRDIEALLNAKLHWQQWPEWYNELDKSLLNYGLPDFSAMPLSSADGRDELCAIVRKALLTFEPRFSEISVTAVEEDEVRDRVLQIRIDATCEIDGMPEHISFESEVEPLSLGIKIAE